MPILRNSTRSRRGGFTLLEIMLAVAVLAMVTVSIYRFVDTTLTAVRFSREYEEDRGLDDAFERFFRAQIAGLPVRISAIYGEPHLFGGTAMDEIRWYAQPGFGSMTHHARGEQLITLTAQEDRANGTMEVGMRRQDAEARHEAVWTPLLQGVKGFEIRYFTEGSQEWVDKWTDQMTRPSLVRLRYWRGEKVDPVEIVVRIPSVASEVLTSELIQPGGGIITPSVINEPIFSTRRPGAPTDREGFIRSGPIHQPPSGNRNPPSGPSAPSGPSRPPQL